MRKVKTEAAVGLTLCHDITMVRDGFKGRAFQRGHVVTEEDIPRLLDLGKRNLFVWEEQAGEIHEEDAALRLAALTPSAHLIQTAPSEGKVSLTSDQPGLFRVNVPLLTAINSIGDITITSLPDHYPVQKGQTVASMRIVPLVCPEAEIVEAERQAAAAEMPLFQLLPYRKMVKTGIIITGSEIYTGRIQDKFEPVIRTKLSAFGAETLGCTLCDDDLSMLSRTIEAFLSQGAELIVMTGGMSVDPDDLTPTAIRNTGAAVVSQGLPAQPGNMFTLAYLGETAIVGVPGAAIHRQTTVFDVLLPQLMTGVPLEKENLVRLGDGGLCQQCQNCHWPNCTFGRY